MRLKSSNHLSIEILYNLVLNIFFVQLALGINGSDSWKGSGYNYTSFLPKLITCMASQPPLSPTSLSNLQSIVHQAIKNKIKLKPLGSLHSCTDIICTSGAPINMKKINHFKYDPITGQVTVGAGTTLLNCLEKLHSHGRTLLGVPTYGEVTIGGALGSGTHGSWRLTEPGTIADQLISLVMVDGRGIVRNISESELLRAFKANLGLLGIIYEVVIATVPQFKLQIRHFPSPDNILWEEKGQKILKYVKTTDRFQLWWFPTTRKIILSVGERVAYNTSGLCDAHFLTEFPPLNSRALGATLETIQKYNNQLGMFAIQAFTELSLQTPVLGRSPIFSESHNNKIMCATKPPVGFSHKMVLNSCNVCPWDHGDGSIPAMEFAVGLPLQEFHGAIMTIREILADYPMAFPLNGIYIRFLSSSDGLMMMNGGRETVVIEWVLAPRRDRYRDPMMGMAGSQAMMQALISRHRGRPHWSKNGLYYSHQNGIRKAFPEFSKFLQVMEDFDPDGIFLNEFGARLRFGSNRTSIDRWVKHCALVDNCICENDNDCGQANRSGSLVCGQLKGYKVCREKFDKVRHIYKTLRGRVAKTVIKRMNW